MSVQSASPEVRASARTGATETMAFRRWSVLILLSLGAVIAFIDRTSIASVLAVGTFRVQFHLTDLDRGALASAFFWSYALLQIPMGWIVDRYGVKFPYAIMFGVWCVASACTGLMSTFSGLIIMRIFTGVGESIVVPASYRWIRANFTEDRSGFAVGIYMIGTKIGPAVGAPLAAWLIVQHSWRFMFLLCGVVGLLWLVPWMLLARNDSSGRGVAAKAAAKAIPLRNVLSSPLVWGTIIINFCYNYFVFYCMTWMPAYLVEQRGLSLRTMGLYSFFSFGGIALVALASGWAADVLIRRGHDAVVVRKAFVIAGFALACTELLGAVSHSLNGALFWNVVSLSGLGFATANHLALCRLTLIPAPAVGLVTGIQNVSTSLAGIVAPLLSGWLLEWSGGYRAPMEVIFVFLVVGAVTCIVLLRRRWAPVLPDENDDPPRLPLHFGTSLVHRG
ncbi:MFS transporter [Acetobacter musti]|nr:MFS transporter [Acetobacter musti]